MIRFDRTQRDVLAVCSCGWRFHAAGVTASMVADRAAHAHIGGPAHAIDDLERLRAQRAASRRLDRAKRDTPHA